MPYITFTEYPDAPGRQYRDVCTDPATGAIAAEIDEVLEGETEISADEHARIKAAAEAWHEANPPAALEPLPTAQERAVEAVRAIDLDVIKDADTKAVIKALRDAVLGEPQAEEFSVIETEGAR